jgi:hypothetical protein
MVRVIGWLGRWLVGAGRGVGWGQESGLGRGRGPVQEWVLPVWGTGPVPAVPVWVLQVLGVVGEQGVVRQAGLVQV